jgi:hypothetical protein
MSLRTLAYVASIGSFVAAIWFPRILPLGFAFAVLAFSGLVQG